MTGPGNIDNVESLRERLADAESALAALRSGAAALPLYAAGAAGRGTCHADTQHLPTTELP